MIQIEECGMSMTKCRKHDLTLIKYLDYLQAELSIFKCKAEEFEGKYNEAQQQIGQLLKDTEESNSKINQMQEKIER